ncbi:MAG: dihydropteroate synthase [Bacteroidetes bacterium]|nr:dihydropteroate synthase [Bacteroidota bacterium]
MVKANFHNFAKKNSLSVFNCNGKLLDLSVPAVMGILNITPDSFFDGGKYLSTSSQLKQVERMLEEGAGIIDIGAVSTRPGAVEPGQSGELQRLLPSLKAIRYNFPSAILSIDTYRPLIARAVVEEGADMINDIYGGRFETGMMETIASLQVPYIIMHMKGTPLNMQESPSYSDVVAEVCYFFEKQITEARQKGVKMIILDPGFGFGKSVEHNYQLLSGLERLISLEMPVLVGLSRKSMIYKVLGTSPGNALNGSTVLQAIALIKGACILRSHDVKEAVEAVKLLETMKKYSNEQ